MAAHQIVLDWDVTGKRCVELLLEAEQLEKDNITPEMFVAFYMAFLHVEDDGSSALVNELIGKAKQGEEASRSTFSLLKQLFV